MDLHQSALEVLFSAVDQANEQLAPEAALKKSPGTIVFGPLSPLDSLGYVNFVAAVEEKCEERFGTLISISDMGMEQPGGPETLGQLAEALVQLISSKGPLKA